MDRYITHACGHQQVHHLIGFEGQQDRKATWLATTQCQTCFLTAKRSELAEAGARLRDLTAHLDLPLLTGSERQVAWATTIRAERVASVTDSSPEDTNAYRHSYLSISDAKWWIDNRNLTIPELEKKSVV